MTVSDLSIMLSSKSLTPSFSNILNLNVGGWSYEGIRVTKMCIRDRTLAEYIVKVYAPVSVSYTHL